MLYEVLCKIMSVLAQPIVTSVFRRLWRCSVYTLQALALPQLLQLTTLANQGESQEALLAALHRANTCVSVSKGTTCDMQRQGSGAGPWFRRSSFQGCC